MATNEDLPTGSDEQNSEVADENAQADPTVSEDGNDPQLSEVETLEIALEAATAKADANWDRVLRMQADMENTRKRLITDADNARKFGQKNLIEELLPIADSLQMGLASAQEEGASIEKIVEGYELTSKMLTQMLEKFNVIAIDPVGEKFNPEHHQAMSMIESADEASNTVVSVMQKGYTLNDRLVRPALVIVAK